MSLDNAVDANAYRTLLNIPPDLNRRRPNQKERLHEYINSGNEENDSNSSCDKEQGKEGNHAKPRGDECKEAHGNELQIDRIGILRKPGSTKYERKNQRGGEGIAERA